MTKPNMKSIDMDLTRFDGFEVHGCKAFTYDKSCNDGYVEQVDDHEAEFWSLYGHYDPTDFNNGVAYADVGVDCLRDFPTRALAEKAAEQFEEIRKLQMENAK